MNLSKPKTLLLVPPAIHCNPNRYIRYEPPLGLALIAAVLEKNNYPVKIVDCLILGLSAEQTAEHIKKYQPDLVGIYFLTSNRFDAFDYVANKIKDKDCKGYNRIENHVYFGAIDSGKPLSELVNIIESQSKWAYA